MNYLSSPPQFGFDFRGIADFLQQHGISIQDAAVVQTPANTTPEWAWRFRGLKAFTLNDAALIVAGIDPDSPGYLGDYDGAEYGAATRLLEQAISEGALDVGLKANGGPILQDSQLRPWCKTMGRVWPIPELIPTPAVRTDAELLAQLDAGANEVATLQSRVIELEEKARGLQATIDADPVDPADLPDELDCANQAYRAVRNGYGDHTATFRKRLEAWVAENRSDLIPAVLDRIATVANPDKTRGRPAQAKE